MYTWLSVDILIFQPSKWDAEATNVTNNKKLGWDK